jgi:PGF-CTERM protein
MRERTAVVFAALVVLSSVAPAVAAQPRSADAPAALDAGQDDIRQQSAPPDPEGDRIGWEGGYWHNESIDVDQSDGLTAAEREAYVARAMARVEYIRGSEFDSEVPVEIISREEFRRQSEGDGNTSEEEEVYGAWNNQVWEALFVVGEDTDVQQELRGAVGGTTAGFYTPAEDHIRIVTDSPGSPVIDNTTLVHELVHALQDQHGRIGDEVMRTETQDADLAVDGVVEGEANYVERQYVERCGAEWECVATPSEESPAQQEPPNLGILLTLLHPYSDGPVYVDWLLEQGGWAAVDARFDDPPASSEQIIHLTDEEPTPIEFEDRGRNGWETFPEQGENGSDTVGEASMFVMFWYQARTERARTIPVQSVGRTSGPLDQFNYDAEPSAGWGNDRLFPYRNPGKAENGYVWVTEWDTPQDAGQFAETYRAILAAHDATERDDGRYVIDDGPYADVFRIDRSGTRVTVVNGPTPDAVGNIRPASDAESGDDGAATADDGDGDSGESDGDSGESDGDSGESDGGAPGFGPLTALLAVVAALALLARRRS